MPKNTVSDPITDQEMAFAHLILSGTMTDRRAAEAVGLNPETAAYTKSKPRVRAYMIEHHAAVRERLVDQEAEGLLRISTLLQIDNTVAHRVAHQIRGGTESSKTLPLQARMVGTTSNCVKRSLCS
jgi:hypothetical protein